MERSQTHDRCAMPDCSREALWRGFCSTHYQRGRRTGFLPRLKKPGRQECVVADCGQLAFGHGLCSSHYTRQRRYGTTDDPRPSADVRFWSKVDRASGPKACWLWMAKRNLDGYGIFWFEARGWFAHRWAYEQSVGPVGDLSLDHLCRNRACVNPAHLEAIPIIENVMRGNGFAATNARKTHCKRGHPFDERNTYRMKGGGRMCRACANLRRHQRVN
jgi:hypothetical protein